MLSQNLLYRFACHRINNEINTKKLLSKELSSDYYCDRCYKEYMNDVSLTKHKNKCKVVNDEYNCICINKKYISQESRFEHEKKCDDDVVSELIIEEDWLKVLYYYDEAYIKDLKNDYKEAFLCVKHLRNKKFLTLLDKISNESRRFKNYLNERSCDYPTQYWSSLSMRDFEICAYDVIK